MPLNFYSFSLYQREVVILTSVKLQVMKKRLLSPLSSLLPSHSSSPINLLDPFASFPGLLPFPTTRIQQPSAVWPSEPSLFLSSQNFKFIMEVQSCKLMALTSAFGLKMVRILWRTLKIKVIATSQFSFRLVCGSNFGTFARTSYFFFRSES